MARTPHGAHRRDRAVNLLAVLVVLGGGATAVLAGPDAQAESSVTPTGPSYAPNAAVTHFKGLAFDTCITPPLSTMRAWLKSPYRAIGVYTSGSERACKNQPHLNYDWVRQVSLLGWRIIPIDVGKQAPCRMNTRKKAINPKRAYAQGRAAATKAVFAANDLGIRPGSALYSDMEHYRKATVSCINTVAEYINGWTAELHHRGYLSGMYAHPASGSKHAAARYTSTRYVRSDILWTAQWDRQPSLTGWQGVRDSQWSNRQRIKQYRGDHLETHGGVTLNIDSNVMDAPVATVATTFPVKAAAVTRRGPSIESARLGRVVKGGGAVVLCRVERRDGRWYKLSSGNYLPSSAVVRQGRFPTPVCLYPAPVTGVDGAYRRAAAGPENRSLGLLPLGSLAWVECRHPKRTSWLALSDGSWVWERNLGMGRIGGTPLLRCEKPSVRYTDADDALDSHDSEDDTGNQGGDRNTDTGAGLKVEPGEPTQQPAPPQAATPEEYAPPGPGSGQAAATDSAPQHVPGGGDPISEHAGSTPAVPPRPRN